MAAVQEAVDLEQKTIVELRRLGGAALGEDYVEAYRVLDDLRASTHNSKTQFHWEFAYRYAKLVARESEQAAKDPNQAEPEHRGSRRIATLFGLNKKAVQSANDFYAAFPKEADLTWVLGLRRPNDEPLAWGVVAKLCQPMFGRRCRELLQKAAKEGWSELAARDYADKENGIEKTNRTGGRTPKVPQSLSRGLSRWKRDALSLIKYSEAVFTDEAAEALLAAADAGTVTPDQVKAVRDLVAKTQDAVARELALLDKIEADLAARSAAPDAAADGVVAVPEPVPTPELVATPVVPGRNPIAAIGQLPKRPAPAAPAPKTLDPEPGRKPSARSVAKQAAAAAAKSAG